MRHPQLTPFLAVFIGLSALPAAENATALPISFRGFVDSNVTILPTGISDNPVTAKDESRDKTRFIACGGLEAIGKVGERVNTHVNVWLYPDLVSDTNQNIQVREAYVEFLPYESYRVVTGKIESHLGLAAKEPRDAYSVYTSIINNALSYTGAYGNDTIGAHVYFEPKDKPFSVDLHVTNGYFTSSDATSALYVPPSSPNRQNGDLGYAGECTWKLPNDHGKLNAECAYDRHSWMNADAAQPFTPGTPGAANNLGGNVLHLGINLLMTPLAADSPNGVLTIGLEGIHQWIGTGKDPNDNDVGEKARRTEGMALVNYALPKGVGPCPVSFTAQVQQVSLELGADNGKAKATGVMFDVLTYPGQTDKYVVVAEFGWWKSDADTQGLVVSENVHGTVIALEAFAYF